jgi:hypothetical protein
MYYFYGMKLLPTLQNSKLLVVLGPHASQDLMSYLIAEVALRSSVTVLDGGNRFAAYEVARLLREKTVQLASISKRIFIRRAFTCHQMLALLENTPDLHQPCLLLDILATFYDENVPIPEAKRLFDLCLAQIERLKLHAPVVVSLGPPLSGERVFLFDLLCAQADQLEQIEVPFPVVSQLMLF